MAAKGSGSGVGLIHFALMFFVLGTLAFGVIWYMTRSELGTRTAELAESKKEASTQKQLVSQYTDELTALKKAVGHTMDDIGIAGTPDQTTVLGSIQNDLDAFGKGLKQADLAQTMKAMREDINNTANKRANAEAEVRELQDKMLTLLSSQYQDLVDTADKKSMDEQKRADTADKDRNEKVAAADAELRQRRQEVNQLQIDLDRMNEEYEVRRKSMQNEIALLNQTNTQLREELDNIRKVSFEQPDGVVRKVDHTTGLVWINLGSADDLPPRTTFSVYTKTHHGVGRGEEDIKGAIEVTRVIGPHLAEARILDENYSTPIGTNDPVYTPIWSPGRKHRFAVVGLIDINGDDISDRAQLHEVVEVAGGELDVEIDDDGERIGGELTVFHKFLIMGETPDPTLEIDDEKKEKMQRMMDERDKLVQEARINGVRIVSLDLFLEWAGYRPQQRLWRPGEDGAFTIRQGGAATVVDERAQVSKAYGDTRKLKKQDSSSGQTSKVFGGRYGD